MADSVQDALNAAKSTLAKASNFTNSVEGNPTSSFAPKKEEKPKIPQAHASAPTYSMAAQARTTAEGLKARRENVQQYLDSTK
jgi:hypothetical protein